MSNDFISIIYPVVCYLLGSIQFGYIFSKLFLKKDVTKIGSQSTGTTNVFRLGNKTAGIATLVCDILKGFLPSLVMKKYCNVTDALYYLCIFACVIGHIHSVFLGFKGGKGVATMFGVFLYISPSIALISLGLYIVVLLLVRRSFVASLSMCTFFTILETCIYGCDNYCKIFLYIAWATILYGHRKNIGGLFV